MANLSTTGYKAQSEFYRSIEASMGNRSLSSLNQAVNEYGVLGGQRGLRTGESQKTGNDLDLAVEGAGFFVVQQRRVFAIPATATSILMPLAAS